MADDDPDGPARSTSRGPRVVTGDTQAQAGGARVTRRTATGWAPSAPTPADADPTPDDEPVDEEPGGDEPADDEPADDELADDDDELVDEELAAETLVGPAPADAPPAAPPSSRGPRVVTGRTAPAPPPALDEPDESEPAESTEAMPPPPPPRARATPPRPAARPVPPRLPSPPRPRPEPEPPAWEAPEPPMRTGAPVIPPAVHRTPAPYDSGRSAPAPVSAPGTPSKPAKAPKGERRPSGGQREPLSLRALVLAVASLVTAGILAIPALMVGRRARRRIASHPGARGTGLVTLAEAIAVISLVAWLTIAGLFVAGLVRPDGVDYAKLKPGDCIDTPEGTEVRRLKIRPCDEPHEAEVFALVTHPAARSEAFPGAEALLAYAANVCLGQPFTDYVGIPQAQSKLTPFEIVPESEAWGEGRRGLVCAVDSADRTPLTAPVKGSAR